MSEMRFNPITRDWVIVATGRSGKPNDFRSAPKAVKPRPQYRETCPFCVGNESGPEILRASAADGSWLARILPNKFPALEGSGSPHRITLGSFRFMHASGSHEVVVEHPRHDLNLTDMPPAHLATVLRLYRDRYILLRSVPDIESIIIFKNHGERAGTSMEHSHSQIAATSIVSPNLRSRLTEAARIFDEDGECLYCRVVRDEVEDGARIIEMSPHFVAFIPFAALSPFHLWIFPRRHASSFDSIQEEEIDDLAQVMSRILRRLHVALDNPDFNFGIRSAPISESVSNYSHWYLAIIPRVSHVAGFELGSGMYMNSVAPEEAAETLRQVEIGA